MRVLYDKARGRAMVAMVDPGGPSRVIRGGSGTNNAHIYQVPFRASIAPSLRDNYLGLRPMIRTRGLG